MKRALLVLAFLLIIAHRLPAPIQEVPESPTPTPTPIPQSQPGPLPSNAPGRADPARFAGTWTGRIKIGNQGDFDVTLVVDSEATSLTQQTNRSPQHVHPTTISGRMLLWRGGDLNNIAWTLTPKSNGQTALATTRIGAGVEKTAVFQRVQPAPNPSPAPARKLRPSGICGWSGNLGSIIGDFVDYLLARHQSRILSYSHHATMNPVRPFARPLA